MGRAKVIESSFSKRIVGPVSLQSPLSPSWRDTDWRWRLPWYDNPTSIIACCQKPRTKILDWNLQSCMAKETVSFYRVIASAILRCSWSTQFSTCKERERNPCQSSRRHCRALTVCSMSNHTAEILLCILRMTLIDSAQAWFMPWKVQVISDNHGICATNWSIIIFMGKMQGNGQLKSEDLWKYQYRLYSLWNCAFFLLAKKEEEEKELKE